MHTSLPLTSLVILSLSLAVATSPTAIAQRKQDKQPKVGYTNTPLIPGQKWRVHDADRPRPKIVTAGTNSSATAVGTAPSDATVLFDGKSLDAWTGKGGKAAHWKVKNGYIEVKRGGAIRTKQKFGSCQLHIEWQTPTPPKGKSQGRSNSGVFLMNRYEFQVLDSYDNITYADGQAGAIYGQYPPLVNASRKPGVWQSYDIIFTAPTFKANGELDTPAYATVLHNGVLLHHHRALLGPTTHKRPPEYKAHGADSIQLQDHGNPVRFRNIWIRPLGGGQQKKK